MPKILHVINTFFALQAFVGEQFKYFNNLGYKQHAICPASPNLAEYSAKMDFDYLELEIPRSITPLKDIKSLLSICQYIKRNKIDIVVGHTPKGALLAILAAWIMRVPKRIYYRHSLVYETMKGSRRRLMINLDRLTAFCATEIVCVSPSLARKSLENKLNSPNKQIVLGKGTCGGIDAKRKFNPRNIDQVKLHTIRDSLKIAETDFVISYCGRLVRDKGITELVEAFLNIQEISDIKVKLLLVGDFEVRDSLPSYIQEIIRNHSDIILTGFIYKDIEYYYAMQDIFILPSYREGFGMCVLEASAMEIPVLTTKATGCIDSIIEGETGYYVENSSYSIASTILKIIESDEINEFGKNGRKFVLDYFDNEILYPIIEEEVYM